MGSCRVFKSNSPYGAQKLRTRSETQNEDIFRIRQFVLYWYTYAGMMYSKLL